MGGVILAIIIAFLSDGSYDYGAIPVASIEECQAVIQVTAHDRAAKNENEEVKITGFAFKCDDFTSASPEKRQPPAEEKTHTPSKDEA